MAMKVKFFRKIYYSFACRYFIGTSIITKLHSIIPRHSDQSVPYKARIKAGGENGWKNHVVQSKFFYVSRSFYISLKHADVEVYVGQTRKEKRNFTLPSHEKKKNYKVFCLEYGLKVVTFL